MKTRIFIMVLAFVAGTAQAQSLKGLVNKAKEVTGKVAGTTAKGTQKTATTASGTVQNSTVPKGTGQGGNTHSYIDPAFNTGDARDLSLYANKFMDYKTTANTKTITVDTYSGMELSYYSENRAFVWIPLKGIICIDEKGNQLKSWARGTVRDLESGFANGREPRFNSGRIMVTENNGTTKDAVIYDKNFREIKRFPKVERATFFAAGVAAYVYKKNEGMSLKYKTVFVDAAGNQVLKNISDLFDKADHAVDINMMRDEHEGMVAFCAPDASTKKMLWGFRKVSGEIVVPPTYAKVQDFSNGLAAVASDGMPMKWGFIDKSGKMVIPQQFSIEPSKFDECGLAMVIDKSRKACFVDRQGNISNESFNRITPFFGGVAIWHESKDPNALLLVDSKFNVLKPIDRRLIKYINPQQLYNDIYYCDYVSSRMGNVRPFGDYFYFKFDGLAKGSGGGLINVNLGYGVLNRQGNVVAAGVTGCFVNGLAPMFLDEYGYVGYVNTDREWVVKFSVSRF